MAVPLPLPGSRLRMARQPGVSPEIGYAFIMPDRELNSRESALLPDYSPDGVDLSLIRWFVSLTPAERLAFLEDRIADILRIRALNAGK
jgi:hypothetical protein